mgnify:CR=1 FL=1
MTNIFQSLLLDGACDHQRGLLRERGVGQESAVMHRDGAGLLIEQIEKARQRLAVEIDDDWLAALVRFKSGLAQ